MSFLELQPEWKYPQFAMGCGAPEFSWNFDLFEALLYGRTGENLAYSTWVLTVRPIVGAHLGT
ncbi:hypothetical protein ACTMTI_21605 [Nonomuraea sp. H19]|uniref:hypothetical protein n=1 Tax=Nonomuraea sp. H19 TaxID=3452206 RepID=UPI003F8CC9E3